MAESFFVGGVAAEQPANTASVDLLPASVQTLIVTHPNEQKHQSHEAYRPETRVLDWFEGLHKTRFLRLERMEIVCSEGFGDMDIITQAFEDLTRMQEVRASRVTVVVRNL